MSDFRTHINQIAEAFKQSRNTLLKWDKAENRTTHKELLFNAYQAITQHPELKDVMDMNVASACQFLGFGDSPAKITINGIPPRTWATWCENEKSHELVKALILGMHWMDLNAILKDSEHQDLNELITTLRKRELSLGEVVFSYRKTGITLIKLLRK